jgi:outer membrane protein assembly factor BamB
MAGQAGQKKRHFMKSSELVFIGIKGSVVALNRATGDQVWVTHLKGSDFVNVVVQNEAVLASCYGEIFCLDPLTGNARWHNPLKGFGRGLATIATEHNPGSGHAPVLAEKRCRDEQAAASAAAASTSAASM